MPFLLLIMFGWETHEDFNDIEVLPEGEAYMHDYGMSCLCKPKVSKRFIDDKIMYIHNSYDGREVFERAELNAYIYSPLPKYVKDC